MNLILVILFILSIMMNKIDLFVLKLLKGFSTSKCVYRYFVIDTKGYNEDKYFIFIRKLRI